jgi:FkbM family methyltransferase
MRRAMRVNGDTPPASIRTQEKFEKLRDLSLKSLNYGNSDMASNGETWFVRHLAGVLPNSPIVFDVGANIGAYTAMLVAALNDPVIHCFEPSRTAFNLLQERVGKTPAVHLHNFGFGADEATVTLYADEPGSGMGSIYPRRLDHFGIDMHAVEEVRIARLDMFCAENGIERIDFLKIDTEGHELSVLQSAGEMLVPERIGAIQFEFGGTAIDSRIYFQDFFYLLTPRYTIHRLLPDGLWPMPLYAEQHEVLMYANYICLPSG